MRNQKGSRFLSKLTVLHGKQFQLPANFPLLRLHLKRSTSSSLLPPASLQLDLFLPKKSILMTACPQGNSFSNLKYSELEVYMGLAGIIHSCLPVEYYLQSNFNNAGPVWMKTSANQKGMKWRTNPNSATQCATWRWPVMVSRPVDLVYLDPDQFLRNLCCGWFINNRHSHNLQRPQKLHLCWKPGNASPTSLFPNKQNSGRPQAHVAVLSKSKVPK